MSKKELVSFVNGFLHGQGLDVRVELSNIVYLRPSAQQLEAGASHHYVLVESKGARLFEAYVENRISEMSSRTTKITYNNQHMWYEIFDTTI